MSWLVAIPANIAGGELRNFIMNSMLRNAKKLAVSGYQNPPHFTQDEYPFCDRFLQTIQHFPLFFQHLLLVAKNITVQHIVWFYATSPAKCLASDSILCNLAHEGGDVIFEYRHRRYLPVAQTLVLSQLIRNSQKVRGVFFLHIQTTLGFYSPNL